jgi:hypothetical protein
MSAAEWAAPKGARRRLEQVVLSLLEEFVRSSSQSIQLMILAWAVQQAEWALV